MTITPPDPITAARAELAAIESCWAIASRLPPTSRRRLSTWLISHEDAPVDHRERLPSGDAPPQADEFVGSDAWTRLDHESKSPNDEVEVLSADVSELLSAVLWYRAKGGDEPPDMSPRAVVVFSPPLGSTVMDCRDEAIAFARGNSGLTYFEANEVRVRVHRLDDREQLDARWVEELTRVRGREAKGGDAPQEPSKPDADGRRWWADAGRGPAEHESMAAARLAAEDGLTECYESDWPPGTEDICWGELLVTHEATRDGDGYVLEATRPPGAPTDDPDDDRTCEEHVSRPPGGAEPDSMRTACLAAEACIDVLTTDTDLNVWWLNLGGQGGAYWHDKMAEAVAVALASEGAAPPSEPDPELDHAANVIDRMDISVKVSGLECGRPAPGGIVEVKSDSPSQTPDAPGWWTAMVRVWPSNDGLIMAPIEGGAVDHRIDGGVFTWGAGEPVTAAALEVVAANLVQQWELDTGGSVEDATEQIMQDLRPLLGSTRGAQAPDDGLRRRVEELAANAEHTVAMWEADPDRYRGQLDLAFAILAGRCRAALRGES